MMMGTLRQHLDGDGVEGARASCAASRLSLTALVSQWTRLGVGTREVGSFHSTVCPCSARWAVTFRYAR